ncbi:MAG: hypothetical protein HRT98_03305 [Mycoplasmatales bacterium]|nr:hypothetical protein [Mycoplasmatales bacterium]
MSSIKTTAHEKQVQEIKNIYSKHEVNGHLFEFKKIEANSLILSIEANDYYLTPKEVSQPGSIILKNGLTLKWDKALTKTSTIDDFTIFNDKASRYINYLRILKSSKSSSLLNIRINRELKTLFFDSTYVLEQTIIIYLNYWTKNNSSFWQLDSLGKTVSGRKAILN